MTTEPTVPGLKVFASVWLGQVVSLFGSGLTGFALAVWVYQETGSVTRFALISFFTLLPGIALAPIAGALVDRWDRRRAMILSDAGSGACTLLLALLIWSGHLAIWHIYVLMAVSSACSAVQSPAFSATVTLLVPKRHLGRASGMTQIGLASSQILAPLLAGLLMGKIGVEGVVLIDFTTFLFALATLLVVRFPRPPVSAEGAAARGSLRAEAAVGWNFVRRRPGLLALLLLFAVTNLNIALVDALLTPLVLSFASAEVLGRVLSVAGVGMLLGGVLMSLWGGPRRRVAGILAFVALQGSILFLGGLQPSAVLVAGAAFVFLFTVPIIDGSSQAIWQTKVAPDLQGRVFAMRRMVSWSTLPLGYLLAGPLADRVFEPLLAAEGALAGSVGRVIGVGPGRGIGLLFLLLGALMLAAVLAASRYGPLRRIESELPDAIPETPQEMADAEGKDVERSAS